MLTLTRPHGSPGSDRQGTAFHPPTTTQCPLAILRLPSPLSTLHSPAVFPLSASCSEYGFHSYRSPPLGDHLRLFFIRAYVQGRESSHPRAGAACGEIRSLLFPRARMSQSASPTPIPQLTLGNPASCARLFTCYNAYSSASGTLLSWKLQVAHPTLNDSCHLG